GLGGVLGNLDGAVLVHPEPNQAGRDGDFRDGDGDRWAGRSQGCGGATGGSWAGWCWARWRRRRSRGGPLPLLLRRSRVVAEEQSTDNQDQRERGEAHGQHPPPYGVPGSVGWTAHAGVSAGGRSGSPAGGL